LVFTQIKEDIKIVSDFTAIAVASVARELTRNLLPNQDDNK